MDHKPVLQLVYADHQGNPLALCLVLDKQAFAVNKQAVLVKHDAINSLTWQHNQIGISLLGKQSGKTLEQVQQQLAISQNWVDWT